MDHVCLGYRFIFYLVTGNTGDFAVFEQNAFVHAGGHDVGIRVLVCVSVIIHSNRMIDAEVSAELHRCPRVLHSDPGSGVATMALHAVACLAGGR